MTNRRSWLAPDSACDGNYYRLHTCCEYGSQQFKRRNGRLIFWRYVFPRGRLVHDGKTRVSAPALLPPSSTRLFQIRTGAMTTGPARDQVEAAFADVVKDALEQGASVDVPGLGTFEVRHERSRFGEDERGRLKMSPPRDTIEFTPAG